MHILVALLILCWFACVVTYFGFSVSVDFDGVCV